MLVAKILARAAADSLVPRTAIKNTASAVISSACPRCSARTGVERVVELELTQQERNDFQKSVDAVKEFVAAMAKWT